MADTLATKLQKTAESIYADEYLFHPHNAFFRGQVAPPHADDPTPAIPLATVLSFKCVQDVFDADGADVSSAEKREEVLAAALQRSKVVEVLHDAKAAVAWRVRRRHALDVAKDPARRTIVLRPIPTAATLEELRSFLKPLKVKVEMMEMQAQRGANKSGPADSSARHGLCHIRLHTEAEAQAIISHYSAPASKKGGGSSSAAAARHDFGMAESSLAQHFLPPRIYATALHVYDAHQEIVQQRAADDQLQANIHKAQATLLKLSGEGTTRPARIAHVPGQTLLASGLPEGTTWQVAKAKLGHLLADAVAAGSATMKGGLRMVHVEPATSGTPCRAFIVCRDAAVANALVLRFSMASTEHAELREYFTAGLRVLTTAEESYVEQRLSVWMAGTPGKAAAKRTRE